MKKLLLTLFVGLSLGAVLPQAAHAQKLSVSTARKQIQACYNLQEQAMKAEKIEIIDGLLSTDYTMYNILNKMTDRNAVLNTDRFLFKLPSDTLRYETQIISIQPRGVDMIVMTRLTMETVAGSGARTARTKSIATYRDFWSPFKNSNGWVLRQTVELTAESWMNGKKIF